MQPFEIHGSKVNIHNDVSDAHRLAHFLEHDMRGEEGFNEYLHTAKHAGKAYFIDGDGHKYKITHDKDSGAFNVHKEIHTI